MAGFSSALHLHEAGVQGGVRRRPRRLPAETSDARFRGPWQRTAKPRLPGSFLNAVLGDLRCQKSKPILKKTQSIRCLESEAFSFIFL